VLGLVLADPMDGVRAAWRWLLAAHPWVEVTAEAATVRDALAAPGEAVLSGLRFPDGAVDRLLAGPRPVIVWTFLPADERADVGLDDAVALIGPGELRAALGTALFTALGRAADHSAAATPPRRAARREA
jgi:hypothetical protein